MKKYLMTGLAAVALCAAMTSCSKGGDDIYDPNVRVVDNANQAVEKYNQAFLKYVGANSVADIPSNQTWGFGGYDAAGTRTKVNVNGNLWEECPSLLTADETGAGKSEATLVYEYVNMTLAQMRANNHNYYEELPDNYHNFFVTHVYTGTTKYNTFQDRANTDESRMTLGSGQMNNLQIGETNDATIDQWGNKSANGWYHCNNFNAGNNTDWQGNTLFEESGTADFAYHNSSDSKYHNRWIAVKGEEIHSSLAGKYYICFDFIGEPNNPTTYFKIWVNEAGVQDGTKHHQERIAISGIWASAQNILDADITSVAYNGYSYNVIAEGETAWVQDGMDNPNMAIPSDNTYTDWIIRIVPAVAKDGPEPDPNNVCIIAEDLSAADDTDFDFNDVVFTVEYTSETSATVTIYAAGGTLPLKVDGKEVHGLLGYGTPDPETGKYKMINTGAKADVNDVPTYSFTVNGIQKSKRGNDIKILVDKGSKNDEGRYVEDWKELTATGGEPAAKLCVGTDFATEKKWCDERESIKRKYPLFSQWVLNNPTRIWWN